MFLEQQFSGNKGERMLKEKMIDKIMPLVREHIKDMYGLNRNLWIAIGVREYLYRMRKVQIENLTKGGLIKIINKVINSW